MGRPKYSDDQSFSGYPRSAYRGAATRPTPSVGDERLPTGARAAGRCPRGRCGRVSGVAGPPTMGHAGGWRCDDAGGLLKQALRLVDLTAVGAEMDHSLSEPFDRQ
jgi:hypothetical protein